MEHPADIRHRAGSIEGFTDFECPCECLHFYDPDIDWLRQTLIDLADELERIRKPPASIPPSFMGLGCDVTGGCEWPVERGTAVRISNEQWDELLDVPRRTS